MSDRRNLVITGFMGTGKSVVGRKVAGELGREFVDMDAIIEKRAGKTIPEIFEQDGEAAFRAQERDLCEELSERENMVIATGGGALVNPENRAILGSTGTLVCLDCGPDELLHRLSGDRNRPMLYGDNRRQRLVQLLEERKPAYAAIPHHIDTTHRSMDQVADEVVRLLATKPRVWDVRTPTGNYAVHLEPGGLSHIGALLKAKGDFSKVIVVSDETVWPLYGKRVLDSIWQSDLPVSSIELPAGEQFKTLDTVRILYDRFYEAGLDRSGVVVALGGGVITDMTGFAASTFMRGVALVQVPTTLLGMVDASVGGKVAVDHPRGKNLVGAFVRPLFVMLDPWVTETLPDVEKRSGLAEIVKAGIIADPELFQAFEPPNPPPDVRWMLERALQVKIDVVEEDPYEKGRRAVLNLGHTYAHAFEVLSNYQLHHGIAVGIGMAAAAYLGEIREELAPEDRARIIAALEHQRLPTRWDAHPPAEVYKAMWADKKRVGNQLRFIVPRGIGDVFVDRDVIEDEVLASLERIQGS